ncbi:PP2C family serine/threonine-protein phosphatase [Vitiosangium sp. GDMCC 1.1324]|uniref:PP2C family protein-serine/threonine phosphatase n=1 Tax=Vitiosangium sp. (strain GDMCC 1.1324) TaxID=2138576 RepID=UPI000D34C720|nr:protein phosphatase 2C domain-containing protein [Vitiosangium sp. GDMCC 1.1324]PTL79010.1 serine/threonine-protein phosphatase [Vitiosangium sp. GDMCC 1.1324]
MRIDSAGWTHVGRRSHNEDSWTARADLGLFVVADGLGGYEGGEVASRCVVDTFSGFCERVTRDPEATWPHNLRPGYSREEELLVNCTLLAQRAVLTRRVGQLREMGSTVVALALGARSGAVAHVGDSRLYRLREGRLEALTRDHSVLEEMREAGGEVPSRRESPYGHIITRALGTENAEPTVRRLEVRAGDVYLLCSDGLYEPLGLERLAARLGRGSVLGVAEGLVQDAYAAGGTDNITAIVVGVS